MESKISTIDIPDAILEQFRCSICTGYLSCGPIRVIQDGGCICGRCSFGNTDSPIYRIFALEAVLTNTLFPCSFKQRGCLELLSFGKTNEHESVCDFRSFVCPLADFCTWQGSASEIAEHFSQSHSELIKEDVALKIDLGQNSQGFLMVLRDTIGFVFKYGYNYENRCLKYDIRCCTNESTQNSSYKLQLFNDCDHDCSVGLKTIACKNFNEHFFLNGSILHLNNFLQNLDNPTGVLIKMSIVQSASCNIDIALLDSLKCKKCHNYLLPPLFHLDGETICCDCKNTYPRCYPLQNVELEKTVLESTFPCRWRECKFQGGGGSFKNHESTCPFRRYDCFFPSCSDSFTLSHAVDHLQSHRAQFVPKRVISYKTVFSQMYGFKHLFTIRRHTIVLIQHSMVVPDSDADIFHRIALFSSDADEFRGSFDFEHLHCKLKSKQFILVNKHNSDVGFGELPACFKINDELTVSVHV